MGGGLIQDIYVVRDMGVVVCVCVVVMVVVVPAVVGSIRTYVWCWWSSNSSSHMKPQQNPYCSS